MRHDTNNVTDTEVTAAVTVVRISADPGWGLLPCWQWQCCCTFRTVVRPSIWDKTATSKSGNGVGVWYVPGKLRCVPRFTKLKHRHRNDRRWRCERNSLRLGQWHCWQWQSVGELHDAIFTVSDELSLESPIKSLLQSLASIPQIYQSIFPINRPEIASHFVKQPPKRKTVYSEPCHVLCGEKCPDASRMFALKSRTAWSKHWRQCVWLTCPTPIRATLASRCSKRTARQLPRCGAGARAKSIYCDSSSFGPALFEIWWPDIYLGGPYGPVKDKMYWPELVRRSEKCAGPVLMSRADTISNGIGQDNLEKDHACNH